MSDLNIVVPLEKKCTKCNLDKPLSDYYDDNHSGGGRRKPNKKESQCKPCISIRNQKWKDSLSPEEFENYRKPYKGDYNRSSMYKKAYGITLDDVRKIHEDQIGLCANRGCGIEISVDAEIDKKRKGKSWKANKAFVDHCHDTGKVRGLLCIGCNTALGHIEKKNKMLGLVEYLHKHGKSIF